MGGRYESICRCCCSSYPGENARINTPREKEKKETIKSEHPKDVGKFNVLQRISRKSVL